MNHLAGAILRALRQSRVRAWIICAVVAVALVMPPRAAEPYGDRMQVVLPIAALGCAITSGQGMELFLRYFAHWLSVHSVKRLGGEREWNMRPHGGDHGFPSAHTSSAVFGASSLAHDCVRGNVFVTGVVVIAAGFTGASRMEVGAHTIWQVLAGALWGWGFERAFRRPGRVRRGAARLWRGVRSAPGRLFRGRARSGDRLWHAPPERIPRILRALPILLVPLAAAPAARAEMTLSLYAGWQDAASSDVSGRDPGGVGAFDRRFGWETRPFHESPQYGLRATWWRSETLGFGVEFGHAKVAADDDTLDETGFERFEMTDGMNLVTLNAMHRFPGEGDFTPYFGGGLGVAVPHVEVRSEGGATSGYQLTGPAAVAMAGVEWEATDRIGLFVELKGSFSHHEADLDGGGEFETDITTGAVNLGVSFAF